MALTWESPLGASIDVDSSSAIRPAVQSLPPMGLCNSDLDILGKAPTVLPATDGRVGSTPTAKGREIWPPLVAIFVSVAISLSLSLSLSLITLFGDFGSPSLATFLPNST